MKKILTIMQELFQGKQKLMEKMQEIDSGRVVLIRTKHNNIYRKNLMV